MKWAIVYLCEVRPWAWLQEMTDITEEWKCSKHTKDCLEEIHMNQKLWSQENEKHHAIEIRYLAQNHLYSTNSNIGL
jgi:hypothetical protein